ncbi:MAG: NAD(P)H-dependent oxidoreductase, partial [Lautropia sp.]|nr:NAD(P)H-dependent oxidoreductase [Lautropia sp.]
MPDTLIIAAHPDIEHSIVNRRWLKDIRLQPDHFRVHELYARYPDAQIDVASEQQLVDAHEKLVLQFPVYWFNCPPLMKQWLDQVLTYGWAYGSQGKALTDKTVSLAVSLGTPAEDYRPGGRIGHDLAEVLRP